MLQRTNDYLSEYRVIPRYRWEIFICHNSPSVEIYEKYSDFKETLNVFRA